MVTASGPTHLLQLATRSSVAIGLAASWTDVVMSRSSSVSVRYLTALGRSLGSTCRFAAVSVAASTAETGWRWWFRRVSHRCPTDIAVAALAANAPFETVAITATLPANQIGRQLGQSIDLILGPAVADRNVVAFDIASLLRALAKCVQKVCVGVRRCASKEPDHRHPLALLRACCARPHCRAADKRDEVAPFHCCAHSIISSASC
jgi:hypothetical protein